MSGRIWVVIIATEVYYSTTYGGGGLNCALTFVRDNFDSTPTRASEPLCP